MIVIKTAGEIDLLRQSNLLVSKTHAELAKVIKAGMTTNQLDKIAEEFIRDHGAEPGFKGYRGYPKTLCTSVNDQVVHGIPSEYELKEGDIVSIDCGVVLDGYYGDSAYTYTIGQVDEKVARLLEVTKESLYKGIEMAVEGKRVGDISFAVQKHAETSGFSVVRELVGHGLGKNLHEEPEVPNFGKRGRGPKLAEGMVICIEPMINLGAKKVVTEPDGWTIRTKDRLPSAHFEHAIVIRKNEAEILSTFEYIEETILN